MRILLLTNNYAHGGSERQIIRLAKALKEQGGGPICMSFSPEVLDQEIAELGIPLVCLHKKSKDPSKQSSCSHSFSS